MGYFVLTVSIGKEIKHRDVATSLALSTKQRNPKWVLEDCGHSSSLLHSPSTPLIPTSLQGARYSDKFLLFIGEYVKLFHY